ncbi:MAG: ADP-ribosylglycohydrolase family protein [Planctomycetia bacterium]|nr:ADP-ribosylglycohydrolase family protein [Planctomycetia bacterium]
MNLIDRYHGAMLGLAVGDALGTTLEFKSPGSFIPIKDMQGGGPFQLEPGQWTDDTSMALCLAESLIECKDFDPTDQMNRYVRWYRDGHLSSNGRCFDIGNTVSAALRKFGKSGDPFAGSTAPSAGGNGSLMRLAPIPLAYATNPELAIEYAAEMSRTTHAAPEPIDACRYYTGLIIGALNGIDKESLLGDKYSPIAGLWEKSPLSKKIDDIANGSFRSKQPPEIRGTGYVVDAMEAALWAFWNSETFEDGALKAVNLGDDADTTGAIYGQLAGAYYGIRAIPREWRDKIALQGAILGFAEALAQLPYSLNRV